MRRLPRPAGWRRPVIAEPVDAPEVPAGPVAAPAHPTAEHARLAEDGGTGGAWRRWGPWLAERAWGTVREDYSADGDAWSWLPHDAARSTAYRWSEDGLAGLCDAEQYVCFAFAFWNGVDPILKERMFGLANQEGNHGEDVKELYAYLDATPTGSWLSWAYHYPQREFPYADLIAENARRGRDDPEFEITDSGVLDGCWEIRVDVAKAGPEDLLVRLRATNTGSAEATLHVLPTLWCRNTWSWNTDAVRPQLRFDADSRAVHLEHVVLGGRVLVSGDAAAVPLFCDNETNTRMRYGAADGPAYPKDGINDHLVHTAPTVNPALTGTKAALWSRLTVAAGDTAELRLRLGRPEDPRDLADGYAETMAARAAEADEFHGSLVAPETTPEARQVARQAVAGLVWSQVFYHYDVEAWLDGDEVPPEPPVERLQGRNIGWRHLNGRDVILMPDAWEYPWFASWDLAFHALALAHADPWFACEQLLLLTREWYMKPNGALPAYEWDLGDVNPPVQAWAALETAKLLPPDDAHVFLERVFHKRLLQFTWWVNRLDADGNNVFEGGFLGMDNVGPFDRTHQPPGLGRLEQSDATAWTAMFCLDMLEMALTLALQDPAYEDVATKFFEHFTLVATGMQQLWDEEDGFCYDLLLRPDGQAVPLKVRSVAGLVTLAATRVVTAETLQALPDFAARLRWFVEHKAQYSGCVHHSSVHVPGRPEEAHLLSVLSPDRLRRVLARVLDTDEFLSPHGLRSLSKWHAVHPYVVPLRDAQDQPLFAPVDYEPGESRSGLYGGNSNWRGPVWFPLNLLVLTGLRRFGSFLGPGWTVELPTGSGRQVALDVVADEIASRLCALFLPDPATGRPVAAGAAGWPAGWTLFHEYFHGDTGAGLGASHQTGWTATVVDLLLRR